MITLALYQYPYLIGGKQMFKTDAKDAFPCLENDTSTVWEDSTGSLWMSARLNASDISFDLHWTQIFSVSAVISNDDNWHKLMKNLQKKGRLPYLFPYVLPLNTYNLHTHSHTKWLGRRLIVCSAINITNTDNLFPFMVLLHPNNYWSAARSRQCWLRNINLKKQ